jgi:uncharacterized protein
MTTAHGGHRLRLRIMSGRFALCRLEPRLAVPEWASGDGFVCVTRTAAELSVVCPEERVPSDVRQIRGYVAIGVEGPLAPELVGVLASMATPLADASIPIVAIGTFDTDYVLVRAVDLDRATTTLRAAGHSIS